MGAILAQAGAADPKRPVAIVPSFTFAATALAVEHCGYDVVFMDIDEETWALSPHSVRLRHDLDKIGLVVPVAPFGRNIPQEPWLSFHRETRIPVIIDAAACFESFMGQAGGSLGSVPTVLSFHATKSFSAAEGGAVLSRKPECIMRVVRALNFGFLGDRNCQLRGLNGKMSDYHAAVGLAELDGWPSKAAALGRVVRDYSQAFESVGLSDRLFLSPDIASCYVLFSCREEAEASRVAAGLAHEGIGQRAWYGRGLHCHSHFMDRPRDDLPVTQDVASRLLGLPAGPTLSDHEIGRVASAVARYT
jgi:dTDP-4-amino-4,6-dideoxygalactose transaminase